MTAPPTARPLFAAAHHMPFAYPSPASTIASDTSFSWNLMSPPQEYNDVRHSRESASSSPTAQSADDGALRWITASKPADFKLKSNMQTVRQTAMGSYLKTAKNQPSDKPRANSEASDKSRSSIGSQGNPKARVIKAARGKGKSDSDKKNSSPHKHPQPKSINQTTSNPDTQVARQSTLPRRPIVIPIMTGVKYPFDLYPVPPLVSLGQNLDPFGTMYQSRNSRVNVEALKRKCALYFGTEGLGRHWIPECLKYPHAFLSTLYMAAAFDDVVCNRELESLETAALRQDVIHFVGGHLTNPEQSVADHNIIAVSQLILGEVISRTEAGLGYHQKGIETMIKQRGGLDKLGVNGELASAVSWANLATAVLREDEPTPMYVEYCMRRETKDYPITAVVPESPLYQPHRKYETIERSAQCNMDTLKLLEDVRTMTEDFVDPRSSSRKGAAKLIALCEKITRYPAALPPRGTDIMKEDDRKYEAIRIAAKIQARAIIDRVPLSDALEIVQLSETQAEFYSTWRASQSNDSLSSSFEAQHVTPLTEYSESPSCGSYMNSFPKQNYGVPATHRPSDSSTQSERPSLSPLPSGSFELASRLQTSASIPSGPSILERLRDTLRQTNVSECWSDMAGVLLWIGLVVGAASNKCDDKMLRSYFSATTIRACIMLCFEHPEAIHSTMLKMTSVVEVLGKKSGDAQLVRKDSAVSGKRRKA